MRIGLIIADFELNYTTSFQHTARVKYGVDFKTSDVDDLILKLKELRGKVEMHQHKDVQVALEITLDHVVHVENLLNQILDKYTEVFHVRRPNMKIYAIMQKLRDAEAPSAKELAKEVLTEVLIPEKSEKLTKKKQMEAEAKAVSARRALAQIKKNSAKKT